uniref:Uncharacterized protein n=1 Tax=Populus trichocarpa TaxID=3694 RepID=U5GHU3_POPTR
MLKMVYGIHLQNQTKGLFLKLFKLQASCINNSYFPTHQHEGTLAPRISSGTNNVVDKFANQIPTSG